MTTINQELNKLKTRCISLENRAMHLERKATELRSKVKSCMWATICLSSFIIAYSGMVTFYTF